MALKQLLTNLEKGTTAGITDSHPFHAQYDNGGSTFGNSTSIFNTFTFNQRKLKFGEGNAYDRPQQGFSREPFIGKNQEIPNLDKGPSRFLGFIDSFSDGFVRGGITTAVSRSAKDVARLGKFFLSQRGIGFLFQQLALQATQPDILAGNAGGKIGEFISGVTGLNLNNNRTFNIGLNILGQAAVNFTGVHLNRSGLSPIWQDSTTYSKLVVEKSDLVGKIKNNEIGKGGDSDRGNRLLTLYNGRMTGVIPEAETKEKSGIGKLFEKIGDKVKDLTGESGNSILYEYKKGPGSIYGLGKTTLYRYQNSSTPAKYATDGVDSDQKEYPLIIDVNGYKKIDVDSRNGVRVEKSNMHSRLKSVYGDESFYKAYRENRVLTGTPGLNSIKKENYNAFNEATIDKINALDIHDNEENTEFQRDLIKFYFDIHEGGSPTARINFRAFLDGISDDYSGNWNKFNYAGRGESFYTYDSFDRKIGFSFKIAAQSRHEMKPLYRKLNYLVSSTAPTYSGGRMRGTFAIITIGNLIRKVPGFFNSINLSWQKDYPWEIAMDSPEGGLDANGVSKMLELPHVLDVRCSFTPVHSFIPQTSVTASPFLVNGSSWMSGKGVASKAAGNLLPGGITTDDQKQQGVTKGQNFELDRQLNDPLYGIK